LNVVRTFAGAAHWSVLGGGGGSPRVYVVLGLDLDTPEYAALAPLTAYVWAHAYRTPVTPLVLATGRDVSRLSPSQTYIINALAEAGARVELVTGASAHHPVTAAQLARLVAFALPGLGPDDFLMTSDVDLWPLSRDFWEQVLAQVPRRARGDDGDGTALWVYNGLWTWKQVVKGSSSHLAMSVLGASAQTWCELALRALTVGTDGTGRGTGSDGVDANSSERWRAQVGGALSALNAPDLRWDAVEPPTCEWHRHDKALRMRFPGGSSGEPPLSATPPQPSPPRLPVVLAPTVHALLGALLEAGTLITGQTWPANASVGDMKRGGGSKLWYLDQITVSRAERAMGLCPTLADVGTSADAWPRCILNRNVRRIDRAGWPEDVAGSPAAGGSGAAVDRFADAHLSAKWVLEAPWQLLRPWSWLDPQVDEGSPFFHRYLAGLARLRAREGLRGPAVPVRAPPTRSPAAEVVVAPVAASLALTDGASLSLDSPENLDTPLSHLSSVDGSAVSAANNNDTTAGGHHDAAAVLDSGRGVGNTSIGSASRSRAGPRRPSRSSSRSPTTAYNDTTAGVQHDAAVLDGSRGVGNEPIDRSGRPSRSSSRSPATA
jgi:hypothetical protein